MKLTQPEESFLEHLWRLFLIDGFRDKLSRFLQYSMMFIVPVLQAAGYMDLAAGCAIVRSNMSFLRMAMRFGKPQNVINNINRRHKVLNRNDIFSILKSLSDAVLILYFVTDHPLFLYKLGYLPMSLAMNDQVDY